MFFTNSCEDFDNFGARFHYIRNELDFSQKDLAMICWIEIFVLNLPVTMRKCVVVLMLIGLLIFRGWENVFSAGVVISSPSTGEALRGSVVIVGSTDVDDFQSYEVTFGYGDGSAINWFLIQQSNSSVSDGRLAIWDTQNIADGKYTLRLTVFSQGGRTVEYSVPDLRVRNYSLIETSTPQVIEQAGVPEVFATQHATNTPRIEPTRLSENPAEISGNDLAEGALIGSGMVIALFVLLGLNSIIKRSGRGRG